MMNAFNDNKAGMTGLDKEKIQKIIESNTGMNFNNHSQKQKQRIDERVNRNKDLLATLTKEQISKAQQEMDVLAQSIEAERDLSRNVVHFDMDIHSAVEMRDDPKLRTIPMAVGGESMLSTSNYIARKFGVRSAMPGFIAKKLCPGLVIVDCHFDKYKRESYVVREIFQQYDEGVRMGSLDEACLDLTTCLENRIAMSSVSKHKRVRYDAKQGCICRLPLMNEGEAVTQEATFKTTSCKKCGKEQRAIIDFVVFGDDIDAVVREIRFLVEQATGLTCSAGIAANRMLSKICSDMNKPDGQFQLENNRDKIVNFMRSLPIRKVSGIGRVTEAILLGLDIKLCGDLFAKRAILKLLFSEISSEWFLHVALGSSGSGWSDSEEDSHRKSISVERTFAPQKDIGILLETTRKLCQKLFASIFKSSIEGGKSVTLKIKFASFDVVTRCHSTDFLVKSADVLYPIVETLLKKEIKSSNAVRLLGVRLSTLKFITEGMAVTMKASEKKPCLKRGNDNSDPVPMLIELSSDEEDMYNDSILKDDETAATSGVDGYSRESFENMQSTSELSEISPNEACSTMKVKKSPDHQKRKRILRRPNEAKCDKRGSLTRYFPIDLT
uniref:DNA polymerase kappa n=1 Tax=Ditylenchus dipsaci TaxID=166011 RepID=A0A915EBB0_9BILA